MDNTTFWTEQSLGSVWSSSLSSRCETGDCIVIEYTDSDPISYITRSFDGSICSDICLSYSFGYSYMEGTGEDIYVKYSCNDGMDWMVYQYLTDKATGTDYGVTGEYNLLSSCNNNDNILIRFEFEGNDEPDRLYIDNLYLYRDCALEQQIEETTLEPETTTLNPTTSIPTTSPPTATIIEETENTASPTVTPIETAGDGTRKEIKSVSFMLFLICVLCFV